MSFPWVYLTMLRKLTLKGVVLVSRATDKIILLSCLQGIFKYKCFKNFFCSDSTEISSDIGPKQKLVIEE